MQPFLCAFMCSLFTSVFPAHNVWFAADLQPVIVSNISLLIDFDIENVIKNQSIPHG